MPEKKVVAVFGSFRKDGSEHQVLAVKKPTFLSQKRISGYKLYDMAGKAEVQTGNPEDSVLVDIFRVGPQGIEVLNEAYDAADHADVLVTVEGLEIQVALSVYNGTMSEHAAIITSGDWNGYAATRPSEVGDEEVEEEHEEEEETEEDEHADNEVDIEDLDYEALREAALEESGGDDDISTDVNRITSVVDHDVLDNYAQAILQALCEKYNVTIKQLTDENDGN